MAQITLRASEELVERVKTAAAHEGQSMNEWITLMLDIATDPSHAGTRAERLRERLARAGLLAEPVEWHGERPDPEAVRAAGERAAHGKPLSDYVIEGR